MDGGEDALFGRAEGGRRGRRGVQRRRGRGPRALFPRHVKTTPQPSTLHTYIPAPQLLRTSSIPLSLDCPGLIERCQTQHGTAAFLSCPSTLPLLCDDPSRQLCPMCTLPTPPVYLSYSTLDIHFPPTSSTLFLGHQTSTPPNRTNPNFILHSQLPGRRLHLLTRVQQGRTH